MNPLADLAADLLTPAGDVPAPSPAALSFIVAPDAWDEPTVWSADPDRPAMLLARHQVPSTHEGDALWSLIVAAVQGAAS